MGAPLATSATHHMTATVSARPSCVGLEPSTVAAFRAALRNELRSSKERAPEHFELFPTSIRILHTLFMSSSPRLWYALRHAARRSRASDYAAFTSRSPPWTGRIGCCGRGLSPRHEPRRRITLIPTTSSRAEVTCSSRLTSTNPPTGLLGRMLQPPERDSVWSCVLPLPHFSRRSRG